MGVIGYEMRFTADFWDEVLTWDLMRFVILLRRFVAQMLYDPEVFAFL
jgi:hypothetical protein